MESFSLSQVQVLDDYCVNGLEKELMYLTSFETDKWLAGFRETAGLDTKGAVRYGGWEDSLIGGHSLGHYLTACAQAYANKGVEKEDKEELYKIVTCLVDGLLECQQHSRGQKGYIFGATLIDKGNVELQFDNVEKGLCDIYTQAWVPWYTMHKIIAGLIDVYRYTSYEPALTVAKGLGDWVYNRVSVLDGSIRNTVLSIEYGGMNDCLYDLYQLTKKDEYAVAAHFFDEESLFEAVLQGGKDVLNNRHANTTIPKFLGALKRYAVAHNRQIKGEKVDAGAYLSYAKAFWDMVTEHHTYVTGGNSEWEHFGQDNILDGERTNTNNETCNTYNMLKLSRLLFMLTHDKKYMDYYENAFFNSILSSQNPTTGMTTYFQPMATGYFKVYGERYSKFWCCIGSGMENFTKLNDSIYFHNEDAVFVNMYLSSVMVWQEKNLIITQKTKLPENDKVEFLIETMEGEKTDIQLCLRIPDWCKGKIIIKLEGKDCPYVEKDGYAIISGCFKNGSLIEVSIPLCITVARLKDNKNVVAFKYGPLVLSANLGTKDMTTSMTGVIVTIPAEKGNVNESIALPEGVQLEDFIVNINDYMLQTGRLEFKLSECNLIFSPHYLRYRERYGIYWRMAK